MIRVNLLPQKREAARRAAAEGGQTWLFVAIGLVLAECLILVGFQARAQKQLNDAAQHNQEVNATIEQIKRVIANQPEITRQLSELRKREEAIAALQAARTGPTATLLEISHILTADRGPSVDRDKIEQLKRDNPQLVPNPNWDPRRLWLTNYSEAERTVKMAGLARDGEDVSEFLRRLALSDYYYDVTLLPASKSTDNPSKIELMKFELSAKVRY